MIRRSQLFSDVAYLLKAVQICRHYVISLRLCEVAPLSRGLIVIEINDECMPLTRHIDLAEIQTLSKLSRYVVAMLPLSDSW
jgi:sulfur relay (sulfurtransferase) complex TusBCD TusD component (DsrE family)